jgi:hypothetical protein
MKKSQSLSFFNRREDYTELMPDGKTPEAWDFNPAAFFQGFREFLENHVHDIGILLSLEPFLSSQAIRSCD